MVLRRKRRARLRSALASKSTALVAVDEFGKIPTLLKTLGSALGGTLNSYEVLWHSYYKLITDAHPDRALPLANEYPFYILVESCGADQVSDKARFEAVLESAFESELIIDAAIAQSEKHSAEMWAIRDDIETLLQQMVPLVGFDISIPIQDLDKYVGIVRDKLEEKWPGDVKIVTFGHLGDSNIHLVVSVGPDTRWILKASSARVGYFRCRQCYQAGSRAAQDQTEGEVDAWTAGSA